MSFRTLLFMMAALTLGACTSTSGSLRLGKAETPPDPETVAGDYLQGLFAASQQQYDEASAAFSRASDESTDYGLTTTAFRYSLAAGEFTKARFYAEQLLTEIPLADAEGHTSPIASFLDGDLPRLTLVADHFRTGNFLAAEAALQDPFESALGQAMDGLLEAWAIYPTEGLEAATAELAETTDSSFAGFTPFHLALMFDLENRLEGAEVAYAQSMRTPAADMAMRGYASFVERNKAPEDAIDLYATLTEDRGYKRRVGRMGLARLGQPLLGETEEFQKIANAAPLRLASSPEEGAALVFLNFAWTAYDRAISQREAAIEAGFGDLPLNLEVPLTLAQLAVAADDNLDGGYYIIGAISSYYGQHDVAANAYGKVGPTSWLYNYSAIDRAEAAVAMGQREMAIDLIKDYLKQDALAPDVTLELANLLSQEDRTEEAVKVASEAIEIADQLSSDARRGDNLWRYYFARGVINAEAGAWELAEPDLQQALSLSPEEPGLLNYLGYSYVERGEKLDEALDMIERALESRPTSGAITDSLGWAYYQYGDYKRAVEYLERAVQLEPGDDVITDHLGDAYWQMGRKAEARYEWRRVLEIEELDEELKASIEAKLDGEPPAAGSLAGADKSE